VWEAELDGAPVGGEFVDLGQFLSGTGQADLKSVDFSEPAFPPGLVDAGEDVVADLLEPVASGGVRPQQRAAQT
jgi:hypothetical protein